MSEELIDWSRAAYLSGGLLLMVVLASGFARRARLGALAGALGVTLLVAATTLDERGAGPLERVLAVVLGTLGAAGLLAVAGWWRRRAAVRMPMGRVAGHLSGKGTATALRLWRGELAFGWALLVLAAWLTAAGFAAVMVSVISLVHLPRVVGLLVVGHAVVVPLGALLLLVGAWRATSAARARRTWRPVAWLARAGLLVALGLVAAVTAALAPDAVAEYGPLAFGASERESYRFRTLRGGRELELSGTLGFGVTEDLQTALAANPEVRLIHLDSPGGRVVEGHRLALLIRRLHLGTYVANRCSSACVEVLASGAPRLLATGATVGLHRPHSRLETTLGSSHAADVMVDRLAAAGVDRAFARRGAKVPFDEIWEPAQEELFQARVADRRATAGEVALSGLSGDDLERLPLKLRTRRLFQALFEFERPIFDRLAAAMRAGYDQGQSEVEALGPLVGELQAIGERTMLEDVPRAADKPVRAVFTAVVGVLRQTRRGGEAGVQRCAGFLRGKGAAADGTGSNGALSDALADAMASARLDHRPFPARSFAALPPSTRKALQDVVERLEDQEPGLTDLLDGSPVALVAHPGEACDALVALYQALLELPPEQGAEILRVAAASARDQDGRGRSIRSGRAR